MTATRPTAAASRSTSSGVTYVVPTPVAPVRAREAYVLIAVMVIGWALFALIWRWPAPAFDDTLEAWSWGQHFEFGTYKHPPLTAWVAGAWFRVLPRMDWSAYLLASLMAGIGLIGLWQLIRRLASPEAALAGMALVMLTPFHTVMASNFNANIILLALWPWTACAFVRLCERPTALWGALFGVLAALSMLSKYASVLMLMGCGLALLLHPNRGKVLVSPAPYIAVIVGLLLLSPHIRWLIDNDFPPFAYALEKTGTDVRRFLWKAVTTGLGGLGLLLPAAVAWRFALGRDGWSRQMTALRGLLLPEIRWLLPLALSAFALTVAAGMTGTYKIATNFLIPTVCLMPLLVVVPGAAAATPLAARRITRIAYGFLAGALLVAPVIAVLSARANVKNAVAPTAAVARAATTIWRQTFGVPVKIVAGTEMYELAAAFYSADTPIEFTHFNRAHAPWITPERLARDGLLVICAIGDQACLADAAPYRRTGTVERRLTVAPSTTVLLLLIPPAGALTGSGG